jgi:hypothetical protein
MGSFRLFILFLLFASLYPSLQDGAGLDPHGRTRAARTSRATIRGEEGPGLCPNGGRGSSGSGNSGSGSSGSGGSGSNSS